MSTLLKLGKDIEKRERIVNGLPANCVMDST